MSEWMKQNEMNQLWMNQCNMSQRRRKQKGGITQTIDWSINQSIIHSIIQSIMACNTRDKRRHCMWSLYRGLPRRPGPRSHRTNWRNNPSISQSINQFKSNHIKSIYGVQNEWMYGWTNEQLKINDTKWNEIDKRIEMNEWKLLGKPSIKSAKTDDRRALNWCHCEDWVQAVRSERNMQVGRQRQKCPCTEVFLRQQTWLKTQQTNE